MKKNIEIFSIEHDGVENPALVNFDGPNRRVIARLNPKEILFREKSAINYKKIEFVEIEKKDNYVVFSIFVGENKDWNETQKRKHPIRWRINLIDKSKPFSIVLGKANDGPSIDMLINFFIEKSLKIHYV